MTSVEPGSLPSSERAGAARFTAVLTRPAGQSGALAAALERDGIDAFDFPLIEIAAVADDAPLRAAFASLERYALVVFVSPNAIERALAAVPGFVWPGHVPIGVVGPGSVAELARHGIAAPAYVVIAPVGAQADEAPTVDNAVGNAGGRDDADPVVQAPVASEGENGNGNGDSGTRFDSEALFAALSMRLGLTALSGRPVLIVRGDGGREWLADRLREAGAQVEPVCAYRRVVPAPAADACARVRALLRGAPHAWLLTSSEGVRNLIALADASLDPAERAALLHASLVVPHPRIGETARAVGFDTITASGPGDARILAALRVLSTSSRVLFEPPVERSAEQPVQAPKAQATSTPHSRMTDTNQEPSPSFQPAATPPFPPPMPPVYDAPRRRGGGFVWIVVILLAVATGIAAFAFNRKLDRLDTQLAGRQQALGAQTAELRAKTEQAQATAHQAEVELQQLQGKLADAQTAQQALQQQYQNLASNRDEWTFAEVEQMLSSASEQLQLTGNTQLALFALQSADSRLAASGSPQALVARRAIAQDIDKLKAAPSTDLTGLAIKLDDAIAQVDTLPLLGEAPNAQAAPAASAPSAASAAAPGETRVLHWWRVFSRAAGTELKSLVQVRRLDNADAMLNSPQQGEFIRDNVKLRLLSARLGLLSRNQATLTADLNAADAALARYFDGTSKHTQTVRALLQDVTKGAATVEVPNLNTSLQAVHNTKSRG